MIPYLMSFGKELFLGWMNCWGICGENPIARGLFCAGSPRIGSCDVVDGGLIRTEGEEVNTQGSEFSSAKTGVDVGGGVRLDDALIGEGEVFTRGTVISGEEVTRVGDVPFGPANLVHLGEVFDEVGVTA